MMLRLLLLILCWPGFAAAAEPERWAVYYTDKAKPEAFAPFDLIVLDSDHHPPVEPLKMQGKIVLGYISLGEAESYRSYYSFFKEKKLLLKKNPLWKGHNVIDVRRPEWTAHVVDTLIPAILAQGFDGIMIDTIDSVIQPENDNPKTYAGMKDAAVTMIKTIRARFPDMKIMLNRGFELLPQLTGDIDYVMAENILTDWQPGKKRPVWLSGQEVETYAKPLKRVQESGVKVYAIDYWPLKDKVGVRRIYAAHRAMGFIPYVANIDLQTLHYEPQ